jgi:hypothetical protein
MAASGEPKSLSTAPSTRINRAWSMKAQRHIRAPPKEPLFPWKTYRVTDLNKGLSQRSRVGRAALGKPANLEHG